jgi:hypothetical protein
MSRVNRSETGMLEPEPLLPPGTDPKADPKNERFGDATPGKTDDGIDFGSQGGSFEQFDARPFSRLDPPGLLGGEDHGLEKRSTKISSCRRSSREPRHPSIPGDQKRPPARQRPPRSPARGGRSTRSRATRGRLERSMGPKNSIVCCRRTPTASGPPTLRW